MRGTRAVPGVAAWVVTSVARFARSVRRVTRTAGTFVLPLLVAGLALAPAAAVEPAAAATAAASGVDAASKLRGDLPRVLDEAAPGALVPVSLVLAEQLDGATLQGLAAGPHARTRIVARLRALAARTQAPLLAELAPRVGEGRAARLRPLWLSNVVGVDATPALVRALAARPEVAWINHNPKRPVFVEETRGALPDAAAAGGGAGPDDGTDWGVIRMRAPEVWNDLGVTGRGVLVADIDSGSCYDHPDIVRQVWINPGEDLDHDASVMDPSDVNGVDDDGNGFVDDLIGWNFEVNGNDPRDTSSGHGSHTTGTVAGDGTSGTMTGMAPDAQMMIVKVGLNLSDEVDVWNGMQYAAQNGADLITMSLGWQHSWDPDRATWRRNCETTIAMGTVMIVAAGNEGGGNEPDNVRTPGDVPGVITVGATQEDDGAAYFTSLGPVTWEGVSGFNDYPYPPGLVKPDVSAPGNNTVSLNFCSGYTTMSGTSMATPHVAGAAALMLEANGGLSRDDIDTILQTTAIELGEPGKDNTFGAGLVDAYAAVYEASAVVRYAAHRLDDAGLDRGNGDGALDPGELVQVIVSVRNDDAERTFTGIEGFLYAETPGVRVLDNRVAYPTLAPGQQAEPAGGTPFTIEVETPCFTDVTLRLDVYTHEGRRSRSRFVVRVGTPVPTVLFADDGETDRGWAVSGTASDGRWERGVPKGTVRNGKPANPGEDAGDPGTRAWVTGNAGVTATDDDVDGGETVLTSPALDASMYATLTLSYQRWYFREGLPSYPPDRWYIVEASDDGLNWAEVETQAQLANAWTAKSFPLEAKLALTATTRVRVRVQDGAGGDAVVEGGLDDVRLAGDRIVCDALTPTPLAPPPSIGASLRVARSGAHLVLTWTTPAPGPGQGPATRFSVRGGADVAAPLPEIGGATRDEWWDFGAATADGAPGAAPALRGYLVVAENNGGATP